MGQIGTKEKKEIIEIHKQHGTDTGSSQVQIALLTERINLLVEHLKKNKKDHHTRRGLIILVGRRRKLINYMKKTDPKELEKLAKKLKIKIK